jgi:hypothetical protein
MIRGRSKRVLVGLVVAISATTVAWALWTTFGADAGQANVGTLTAPSASATPAASTGTHTVSWTAATVTGNPPEASEITYTVKRKLAADPSFSTIASGDCSGTKDSTTLDCDDTVATSGTYLYQVIAKFRGWTATSNEAGPVVVVVGGGGPVDTTAPTVTSIVRASGAAELTNAGSRDFTVTFSENVTGVDTADFITTGTASGSSVTGVSPAAGPATTYTVTVNTGTSDGTVGLKLVDNDTIQDMATVPNRLGGTGTGNGDFTSTESYTIDKTAPQVQSIDHTLGEDDPTNKASVKWTVVFTEDVTDVEAADFTLVTTGDVTGTSIASVSPTGGFEDTYTVTVNTGSGNGTLGLNLVDDDSINDAATNVLRGPSGANGNFTGETYTIDKSGPWVQSIAKADPDPTNLASVKWLVTFSHSVTGVTTDDFALVAGGGINSQQITQIEALTGATYRVTASAAGEGTLGLNLNDNNSIKDQMGNSLGATITGLGDGSFTGEVYTVDKTTPTLTKLEMFDADKNGKVDKVEATFSETLASYTVNPSTTGWTLANVPSNGSLSSVTVATNVATLNIAEGAGAPNTAVGSFTVKLDATAGGVRDAADNRVAFAPTAPADKAAPARVRTEMFDGTLTAGNGKVDKVEIEFSEALAGYTAATAPWNLTGVPSNGTLSSVSVSSPTATLNITEGAGAEDTAVGAFQIDLAANAAGIRDAAGNQTSFLDAVPSDKAEPVKTKMEMLDTSAPLDGKVDKVEATFSETLAGPFSAANSVWTLTNAPGGAANVIKTTGGVSLAGAVANLSLDQGTVNTSAGTWGGAGNTTLSDFTIALAANANGVRDAAGNQSAFTAANVTDKAKPIPTTLTFTPASAANSAPSLDDKFAVAFSEPLGVASMCTGGTAWTNNLTNQVLNGNNANNVILQIQDDAAPGTANDLLSVQSVGGKCTTFFRFGALDLGSKNYTTATRTFKDNGGAESRIDYTFGPLPTLTFELGTPSAALTAVATPANAAIYAPAATAGAAVSDIPGNEITGTATNNGAGNTRW